MNLSARSALWAMLALSPFAYLACSSDDSSGAAATTTPEVDASTSVPVADAAPVTTVDAGSDAATDAATDAGSTTAVTVTVVDTLQHGVPNASVVFYDTNNVATTVTTDATGKASSELPMGGAVTAVYGTTDSPRLFTILGVKAGDRLRVLDDAPLVTTTAFVVTRPATDPTGATSFNLVYGVCSQVVNPGAGPTTVSGTFQDYCWNDRSSVAPPLLLVASGSNGPIAVSTLTDYTVSASGTTAVTFPAWVAAAGQEDSISATGVPPAPPVGQALFGYLFHASGFGSTTLANGNSYIGGGSTPAPLSQLRVPGSTFQQDEVTLFDEVDNYSAFVIRSTVVRQAPTALATVDVATLLPAITGTTLTVANGVPSVAITSQATLAATDAIYVQSVWNTGNDAGRWTVLSPPSATTVTPPVLPTALAAYAPPTVVGNYSTPVFAGAIDVSSFAGYDAARAAGPLFTVPAQLQNGYASSPAAHPLPVDGTLKLTAYSYNND